MPARLAHEWGWVLTGASAGAIACKNQATVRDLVVAQAANIVVLPDPAGAAMSASGRHACSWSRSAARGLPFLCQQIE